MLKGLFRLPEKDKSQVKNNENTKKYDEIWWNMKYDVHKSNIKTRGLRNTL